MAHNLNYNNQTGKHSFFSYGYAKLCITVTGYFQNVRNYKDDESKFKSIMYGTGLQRSQTAFDLCDKFSRYGIGALN
jgi:hypothetical protein